MGRSGAVPVEFVSWPDRDATFGSIRSRRNHISTGICRIHRVRSEPHNFFYWKAQRQLPQVGSKRRDAASQPDADTTSTLKPGWTRPQPRTTITTLNKGSVALVVLSCQVGYRTGAFGKVAPLTSPLQQGFDTFLGQVDQAARNARLPC